MELPNYHWPTMTSLLRSTWDRGSGFIKKAGSVILLASVLIWAGSVFGMVSDGTFGFDTGMLLENSVLGIFGRAIDVVFLPLGFGTIRASIATVMGLLAKEEVVAVFGVLDFEKMSGAAGFSFLCFNLLCAPCIAAISAIRSEMKSTRWTLFAIAYQTVFAYCVSLMIYQFGRIFEGNISVSGFIYCHGCSCFHAVYGFQTCQAGSGRRMMIGAFADFIAELPDGYCSCHGVAAVCSFGASSA